jgi:hypothetical protein
MNRPVKNTCGVITALCSLTLLLILSPSASAQEKPAATLVNVDFNGKAKAVDVTKAARPTTANPEKRKSIWREPAWYVAIGGSALDIAGSIASIDGKRVQEGNGLFRASDGKVAWERALPFKAISLYLQYRGYKNPKHRKWAIVSMLASGIVHGTLGGVRGFAMR